MIDPPTLTARRIADALGRAVCRGVYPTPSDDIASPVPPEICLRAELPDGQPIRLFLYGGADGPTVTDHGQTVDALGDLGRPPDHGFCRACCRDGTVRFDPRTGAFTVTVDPRWPAEDVHELLAVLLRVSGWAYVPAAVEPPRRRR